MGGLTCENNNNRARTDQVTRLKSPITTEKNGSKKTHVRERERGKCAILHSKNKQQPNKKQNEKLKIRKRSREISHQSLLLPCFLTRTHGDRERSKVPPISSLRPSRWLSPVIRCMWISTSRGVCVCVRARVCVCVRWGRGFKAASASLHSPQSSVSFSTVRTSSVLTVPPSIIIIFPPGSFFFVVVVLVHSSSSEIPSTLNRLLHLSPYPLLILHAFVSWTSDGIIH